MSDRQVNQGTARSDGDPQLQLPLWEIVQTSHVVARAFAEAFAEVGLTPAQFGVLASIADEPGITQAAIARNTMTRPQTVAGIIADLERAGLLERRFPRARGRRGPLTLTSAGRSSLDAAWPGVVALNDPARTGLSTPEADQLVAGLRTIRDRLDDRDRPSPPRD